MENMVAGLVVGIMIGIIVGITIASKPAAAPTPTARQIRAEQILQRWEKRQALKGKLSAAMERLAAEFPNEIEYIK